MERLKSFIINYFNEKKEYKEKLKVFNTVETYSVVAISPEYDEGKYSLEYDFVSDIKIRDILGRDIENFAYLFYFNKGRCVKYIENHQNITRISVEDCKGKDCIYFFGENDVCFNSFCLENCTAKEILEITFDALKYSKPEVEFEFHEDTNEIIRK